MPFLSSLLDVSHTDRPKTYLFTARMTKYLQRWRWFSHAAPPWFAISSVSTSISCNMEFDVIVDPHYASRNDDKCKNVVIGARPCLVFFERATWLLFDAAELGRLSRIFSALRCTGHRYRMFCNASLYQARVVLVFLPLLRCLHHHKLSPHKHKHKHKHDNAQTQYHNVYLPSFPAAQVGQH
jgi:hypothetical protein